MSNKVILLYHRKKSVKTIEDFIKAERINTVTAQDLFDQNKEFIYSQMTMEDKLNFKNENGTYPTSENDLVIGMTLPCPCQLKINPKDVTAEIAINQTNLQADTDDFFAFENEQIQEVVQEEPYSADIDRRVPECQVIGFFKSLYRMYDLKDKRIYGSGFSQYRDVSQHVLSLQTNVGKNGGNFTIRFPHLTLQQKDEKMFHGEEYVNTNKFTTYVPQRGSKINKEGEREIFAGSSFRRDVFSSEDYYSNLISSNDLLFISFNEELIGVHEGNYDMIGLVDEVHIVRNAQGADVAVEVTGRDLMKLLIEDGSFFFNPSVVADSERIFWNIENVEEWAQSNNRDSFERENSSAPRGDILSVTQMGGTFNPLQRMIGSRDMMNMISVFAHRQNMQIGYVIKAVISQLSNIQVVPGYIFDGFPNRTTFNDLQPKEE